MNLTQHLSKLKYLKLLLILLIFQSCDESSLTGSDLNDLEKLRVNISIKDGNKRNSLNSVTLRLTDGEKQIINENITILLNDSPLNLFVKKELYYTKKSFYTTDSLRRKESYYFEIILPDSTRHPLAFIKPTVRSNEARFNFSKQNSINEDFKLEWENINTPTFVEIWKRVHEKEEPNRHSGGPYSETTIHHITNSENGSYTVPKSFYQDSLTIADYLTIRYSSEQNGLTNPKLMPSKILYSHSAQGSVELVE